MELHWIEKCKGNELKPKQKQNPVFLLFIFKLRRKIKIKRITI